MSWPAPTPPTATMRRIVEPADRVRLRHPELPAQETHVWEYEVPCPRCPPGVPPIRLAWVQHVHMDALEYMQEDAARLRLEQQRRHGVEVARLTAALAVANRERAALRSKVVKQGHQRSKRTRGY